MSSIARWFAAGIAVSAIGFAIAEFGQFASPITANPWLTGVGVAVMAIGIVFAIAQLRRAQRARLPVERGMWLVLGLAIASFAAFWLYVPLRLNVDQTQSIWAVHELCASGAYEPGPCAETGIVFSWLIGLAGLGVGISTAVIGWFITAFTPDDSPAR